MNMIGKIHGIVWGPWTPVLFLMVGFVYSVRIRFFQIREDPGLVECDDRESFA